jgi:hypothetical protein
MWTLTNLLALFAFTLFVISQWNTEKRKKLKRALAFSITFFVFVVTIIKGCNDISSATLYSKRQDSLGMLQDTLRITRDTLIKIGIGIDDKTGRLLVLDRQLLKKEFTKVFNVTYITNEPPKYTSETFTNSIYPSIRLSHVPIEGTETYFINGVFISDNNCKRVGNKVTFKFPYAVEASDVIIAKYSYK